MSGMLAIAADVTVILALALAAVAVLRRRSAAERHAVLAVAIAAAALSPALELVVPQVPVVGWHEAAPVVTSGTPFDQAEAGPAGPLGPAAPDAAIPWAALLTTVWMLGVAVTLAGLVTGRVRLARLMARCTPVRAGRWREAADELSRAHGLRRRVAVLQSMEPSLLVVTGLVRPAIILPAGVSNWTDERLRAVLAHELAHVRRFDGVMLLVGELVRAFHWFNPLVWLVCRVLRQESEHACDDAVLREGIGAAQFAAHLLGIARQAAGFEWAVAPAMAHPSTLERRIAAVLNHQRNRSALTRRSRAAAVVAAAAVALPLAAAGVAPAPEPSVIAATIAGDTTLPAPPPEAEIEGTPAARPRRAPSPPAVTVAIAPTTAAEQQTPATASGVILDQTGGALPGVAVTVTDRASGEEFRTVSDGGGRFAFRTLPPAQYALVARLPGFAAAADSLSLTAGASTERVITLALGTIVETISVDCSATRAIGVSEPRNLAAHDPQPRRGGTPVLIEAVFDRVLQTFVPVLSAQTADRAPVRVGGNISAPRRLTFTGPRCPSALPSAEALVIVVGHIGVDGHVSELRVLRTPLAELGELAAAAVREWTFTPTLLNGDPVAITATFQFVFRQ